MGAPAQSQQPVFYDTEQGQYYTMNNQNLQNPANSMLLTLLGRNNQRNYLNNPYSFVNAERFIPKTITPQYPEMNMLFPALNTGLLQSITSSTQPNGAMYGAGRFLAPQTTSESKGK